MIPAERSIRVGLSFVVCLLFSSSSAAGEELAPRSNTLSIGVTGGVFLPDTDVHDFYFWSNTWQPLNSLGAAVGLRVGYDVFPFAGVEVEAEAIPIETEMTGEATTILGWRAHLVGQVPGRLTPFFLLGAGSMSLISASAVLGDDTDVVGHLGAGAKFFITSRLAARLDGRVLVAPKHEVPGDYDDLANHFLVSTSLSWAFGHDRPRAQPDRDPDKDGFQGDADRCPMESGMAPDGCPVADRDGDGVVDKDDRCPDKSETANQFEDEDGCPDTEPDQDQDKIVDRRDTCPAAAEDIDGFQDEDGCPDPDNDSDSIADAKDGCADAAGPVDNGGCPDKDGDGDGSVDRLDNCPTEAGSPQNHGCRSPQLVVISQNELKVLENVSFATGKAAIRPRSNPLLDNLARVLTAHPEISRVYVEGYTDNRGDAARNKDLSQKRAQAVVEKLIDRGVPAERLEAIGHGEENPIADNKTSPGRSQNRRVEFRIDRKPVGGPAATPPP